MSKHIWRAIPPLRKPISHSVYTICAAFAAAYSAYLDMPWFAMLFGLFGGWFACDAGFHFFWSLPISERTLVSNINDAELCDGLSAEDMGT